MEKAGHRKFVGQMDRQKDHAMMKFAATKKRSI